MKKLIIALAVTALSQASFASEQTTQALGYTVAEIIATTAVTFVTSEAGTFSTSEAKKEAQKIQVEVQEYNQTGSISNYLGDKIKIVSTLDDTLSTDESVDVLLAASEIILSN